MGGAAAVIAGVDAPSPSSGLPVDVEAWVPMAENMPSGTAIRPSDVLTHARRQDRRGQQHRRRGPAHPRPTPSPAPARTAPTCCSTSRRSPARSSSRSARARPASWATTTRCAAQVVDAAGRAGEASWPHAAAGRAAQGPRLRGRRPGQHRAARGRDAHRRAVPAGVRRRGRALGAPRHRRAGLQLRPSRTATPRTAAPARRSAPSCSCSRTSPPAEPVPRRRSGPGRRGRGRHGRAATAAAAAVRRGAPCPRPRPAARPDGQLPPRRWCGAPSPPSPSAAPPSRSRRCGAGTRGGRRAAASDGGTDDARARGRRARCRRAGRRRPPADPEPAASGRAGGRRGRPGAGRRGTETAGGTEAPSSARRRRRRRRPGRVHGRQPRRATCGSSRAPAGTSAQPRRRLRRARGTPSAAWHDEADDDGPRAGGPARRDSRGPRPPRPEHEAASSTAGRGRAVRGQRPGSDSPDGLRHPAVGRPGGRRARPEADRVRPHGRSGAAAVGQPAAGGPPDPGCRRQRLGRTTGRPGTAGHGSDG